MNILVVGQNKKLSKEICLALEEQGHVVFMMETSDGPLSILDEEGIHVAFIDLHDPKQTSGLRELKKLITKEPNLSVIALVGPPEKDSASGAIEIGASDYIEDPITPGRLKTTLRNIDRTRKLRDRVRELESEIYREPSENSLAPSESELVRQLHETARKAANSEASLMILGESGVGKSHLARKIHHMSPRRAEPFVTVNCPSLTQELLASELFGHVKGSFTGAVKDHWGKVHEAENGVLFLDEIGEMSLELQPKLLHLLQEKEYERIGENKTRKVDIRIIAATNQDLAQSVQEGRFREDLFYRLNVITIKAPPLRERKEDLRMMVESFVKSFADQCQKPIREVSETGW